MAKYYLLVNFFGTPKKRVGMSDAEMSAIPKWSVGSFWTNVPCGASGAIHSSSANALTASAKLSMSAHASETITIGGVSQTVTQRKDATALNLVDDKWRYCAAPESGSGKGGNYIVTDSAHKVMWTNIHEDFDTYVTASKLTDNEVKFQNPRKKGPSQQTSEEPMNPPGSTL